MQQKKAPQQEQAQKENYAAAPAIELPKGGGAIRSMGEKFATNPVTGPGSMSVPIAVSPRRSGCGPQLSLSYDSGAGNGQFGFGWSLSLPSITRKTDKGLPQYNDAAESGETRTVDGITYRIHRYRPRIEGLLARIERWARLDDPDEVHWRSIYKDNILTIYGLDSASRICDPAALGLKRIQYGNQKSLLVAQGKRPPFLAVDQREQASLLPYTKQLSAASDWRLRECYALDPSVRASRRNYHF